VAMGVGYVLRIRLAVTLLSLFSLLLGLGGALMCTVILLSRPDRVSGVLVTALVIALVIALQYACVLVDRAEREKSVARRD